MSSRSNGVTNVRLRRSTTSRVRRSPSCSSSLISRRLVPFDGKASSSWTSWREISTALSEARSRSRKNCLFCGTSEMRATALLSEVDGGSLSGFARRGMRGVRELAEFRRQEVRRLLPDVYSVVADALQGPGDDDHTETVLSHRGVAAKLEDALDDAPVRTVDELVEIHERFGACEVPVAEGVEGNSNHLLAARAHLLEAFDEARTGIHLRDELRELGDRHAVVGHSLEVEVYVKDGQDETKIARDRRLARKQELDAFFDPDVVLVDVVVERDHLVCELFVALLQSVDRTAQGTQNQLTFLLKSRLEQIELFLEGRPHPNLPVT